MSGIVTLFHVLISQPLFNVLVLIYALLPGHNFGLAIILFTILIRIAMLPLLRKQLHQAKAMRELQPELKRIKKETKGDRQLEAKMLGELYKERNISPFGSIGIIIVQAIILLALYSGLRHVVNDPYSLISNSYSWLHGLSWMQTLQADIGKFDHTLFGVVDLTRAATNKGGGIYWPAMLLVIGSAAAQYFQSRQLIPKAADGRSLRQILREAGQGKQSDQSEINAAVGRGTVYLIPGMVFIFTIGLPSALSLYWMVGGIVAIIQQSRILKEDEEEMEAIADEPDKKPTEKATVLEGEVLPSKKPTQNKNKAKKKSGRSNKKRRK